MFKVLLLAVSLAIADATGQAPDRSLLLQPDHA